MTLCFHATDEIFFCNIFMSYEIICYSVLPTSSQVLTDVYSREEKKQRKEKEFEAVKYDELVNNTFLLKL
jgi:hypothetical protein